MRTDQVFWHYPLATEESPSCPACGKPMTLSLRKARVDRPNFSAFRFHGCTRSERFVFEHQVRSPPRWSAGWSCRRR